MKTLKQLLLLLVMAAIFDACNEDENAHDGKIEFLFAVESDSKTPVPDLPDGASLVINLESGNGSIIEEQLKADFQFYPGHTQRIELSLPGANYFIRDFFIVDKNDQILYASPRKNSDAGKRTINQDFFSIKNGEILRVNLTLIEVKGHKAETFGYKSFQRQQTINLTLSIKGSGKPVTGKAAILKDGSVLAEYQLSARMNQLKFGGDNTSTYTLLVTKEGYTTYHQTFSIPQLKEKGNKPIKAVLDPAFTILARADEEQEIQSFQFSLQGESGEVYVNSQVVNLAEVGEYITVGFVSTEVNHLITITGDLDKITSVKIAFYGYGMMDDIDLRHLTGLTEFHFGLSHSPTVLDFTHNTKLRHANLIGLYPLHTVIPPQNQLVSINLDGCTGFTTSSFDDLITRLYQSAKTIGQKGGLSFAESWYQEPEDESTMVIISEASREKMLIMKNTYGWGFYPDIFD